MTKLLTITAIFFAAILMITETDTASAVTKKKPHYVCPTCNYVSDKPGQCPMDKKDLVKVGDYYCKECHTVSSHAGKCPSCGKAMTKMVLPKGKSMMKSGDGKM